MVSDFRIGAFNFVVAGAFLAGLLLPAPAGAQTQQQRAWCENKGNAYSPDMQIDGCTAAIKDARTNFGGNPLGAYNNRGNAYLAKGDYDSAIADYNEVIRRATPKQPSAYDGRGRAYYYKQDYDRAIADYNEAIRLDPKYAATYNDRGLARAEKGDLDGAIADYDQALQLIPKDAIAYNGKALALLRAGRAAEGLPIVQQALELKSDYAAARETRARIREALGDLPNALADYKAALALDPALKESRNGQDRIATKLAAPPTAGATPTPATPPQSGQASYAIQVDGHVSVRLDRTATVSATHRITIHASSAIAAVSQQQLTFLEGMERLETVEAFTEKADGSKVRVPPANIITRDGASGLPATFMRDLKQRTIIFQDVQVGDALVMTHTKEIMQGLFPGQFYYAELFPRSRPFSSARVVVEAPVDLDLEIKTISNGLTDQVEEINGLRRHTVILQPQPYLAEEVRAVAQIDRDPALLVSTFKSYSEMGLAYAAAAFPKAVTTPEIAALANEITKGIEDRRQQAMAIDAWVKKNIRYVAVYLGLGRVVPNDAAAILRNKYGDCKDKATLMAALLGAKGIASEAALINFGPSYTLPEPPTMAILNHVILYLPEFDLYDDPTQTFAAFGILAAENYDKPVVRSGPNGAIMARTPAMRPGDHTAYARTTILVAADGTVTGRTEESNTGIFGIALRFGGANVQNLGSETAAQRLLQSFNTPGTGHSDLGNATDTIDPVVMTSRFTLSQPFKPPAAGQRAAIPFGMPVTQRPGNFLLGPRLDGRKSAFTCYAGRQTEDIEATFAPGLLMPAPLAPVDVERPAFSFHATFKVEGRTLHMRREFISRVAGQVCPPEMEAQIAADMNAVRINVNSAYSFGQAAPQTLQLTRTVAAGQSLRLDFLYSLNPDCSSIGYATIRVIEAPKHGKIIVENGNGFSIFPQNNPRFECNKSRSDGVVIFYEPEPGFVGSDSIDINAIYASGSSQRRHYTIAVQ